MFACGCFTYIRQWVERIVFSERTLGYPFERRVRRASTCGALLLGSIVAGLPARADDAPFNWTGFYVGGHTGAGMDYNQFSKPCRRG